MEGGALTGAQEVLLADRGSNPVFPTENERQDVLRGMLEWACCELSPHLFEEVMKEMGPDNVEETIFTQVMRLFRALQSTKRDPDELEKLFDAFETTLVSYESKAVKLSKALTQTSDKLLWELKVQICLGRLLGTDLQREKLPTNQSAFNSFSQAVQDYFNANVTGEPKEGKKYYDDALEDLEQLNSLCEAVQSASTKTKKQKTNQANAHLQKVVKARSWDSFINTTRLYGSALLYSCHRGPSSLSKLRQNTIVRTLPEEVVIQMEDSSTRCKLLAQTYFQLGGDASGWKSITQMSEADCQTYLAEILDHAHKNGKNNDIVDEDEDTGDDDEIYGNTAMSPAVLLSAKKTNSSSVPKRRRVTPQSGAVARKLNDEFGASAGGGAVAGEEQPLQNTPRKRPIVWTVEETECLLLGAEEHGEGQWAKILKQYGNVFAQNKRTSVSLKDRWRNLELAKKRKENK